jgi:hypothetical protein
MLTSNRRSSRRLRRRCTVIVGGDLGVRWAKDIATSPGVGSHTLRSKGKAVGDGRALPRPRQRVKGCGVCAAVNEQERGVD